MNTYEIRIRVISESEREYELFHLMKQIKSSIVSDDVEVKQIDCIEMKDWFRQGSW